MSVLILTLFFHYNGYSFKTFKNLTSTRLCFVTFCYHFGIKATLKCSDSVVPSAGVWGRDRGGSSGEEWSCGGHHLSLLQRSRPQSHRSVKLQPVNTRGIFLRLLWSCFCTQMHPITALARVSDMIVLRPKLQ